MGRRRGNFLLLASLAAAAATPALVHDAAPAAGAESTAKQSAASVPELSRLWSNSLGPGFGPPPSGPGPVLNTVRVRATVDIRDGKPLDPATAPMVSIGGRRMGDHTAPILQPWAADVVKAHADKERNDGPARNPINQCRPGGVPFVFYNLGMEMLQKRDSITILYVFDHEVRHVRLNSAHPAQVTPSWFGDSIGYYEGDTLVVDTVGIKTGPYTMVDQFGTPHTDKLHVVERYRLVDYETAKQAFERGAKENASFVRNDSGVVVDLNDKGKHLLLEFTVEDPGAFTTP
ncbi:MAG: hypothetical protein ACREC6_14215, partial [Hyphomicrobiaceae bacterium]